MHIAHHASDGNKVGISAYVVEPDSFIISKGK
jgi:hypothetical protein